jgi:type IV fimbrial biogenesis protein FimT
MADKTFQRGLSLIEACATLTIISVLVTAGWPSLKPTLDRKALQGLAAEMAADLQLARGEAVARQEGVRVAAHTGEGGSCVIVYTGPANACQCGDAAAPVCEAEGRAVTYRFLPAAAGLAATTNVGSMRFDPRLGTATPAGTLQIVSTSGEAVHHVVNLAGRVRSCSPNAAVPGFRAC